MTDKKPLTTEQRHAFDYLVKEGFDDETLMQAFDINADRVMRIKSEYANAIGDIYAATFSAFEDMIELDEAFEEATND